MRSRLWLVTAVIGVAMSAGVGEARVISAPVPLGPHALAARMRNNAEIAAFIGRRGYPDWAEEVEVDAVPPLGPREVRLYYLRFDREVAFTDAQILGRPDVGLRLYDRRLGPEKRACIEQAYLASDPARRAELAADRAVAAADRVERAADAVEDAAARAERFSGQAERSFHARLRK